MLGPDVVELPEFEPEPDRSFGQLWGVAVDVALAAGTVELTTVFAGGEEPELAETMVAPPMAAPPMAAATSTGPMIFLKLMCTSLPGVRGAGRVTVGYPPLAFHGTEAA